MGFTAKTKKKLELGDPTDECPCEHMIKSHKTSTRWNKKKGQMDVRLKCRYCKCNILLKHVDASMVSC